MDRNIKNKILGILFKEKRSISIGNIMLDLNYLIPTTNTPINIKEVQLNRAKLIHIFDVLEDESLIFKNEGEVSLTALGYKKFDPWYKKFWSFLNDDFAKLLSLLAIILSIVATIVSLVK